MNLVQSGDWWTTTTDATMTTIPPSQFEEDGWFLTVNSFNKKQTLQWTWPPVMSQPTMDLLESPNFEWDMGLTVDSTCSTIVNGTMYIVGGPPGNSTQFMKVNDCRLENLGELNWPADRNGSFID